MIKQKLLQIWHSKYGNDQLGTLIYIIWLVLLVLNLFFGLRVLYYLELCCMFLYFFRFFSKNHPQRYAENLKFLEIKQKFTSKFKNNNNYYTTEIAYKFYKCKNCGAKLRVPKGKGKITITCPKCKSSFKGKS